MNRTIKLTLRVIAFAAIVARSAGAQAVVSGIVTDSVAKAPLSNATVQLVGSNDPTFVRNATSDSLGRFRMNDVPLGHYKLGFIHPVLDSIGVEPPLRDVYVDASGGVTANAAIPSPATLRRAICGASAADSGGVILGTVRDSRDESPTARAVVMGEWLEYALGRTGMTRHVARRTATTGENGWFALCNVPSSGSIAILASKGGDSTGQVELEMSSDGFLRQELYLGPSVAEPATTASATPGSLAPVRRIQTGRGHLSGTVSTLVGKSPLSGASVTIIDGPQTRTDSRGMWTISNAPLGTRVIEVRALGYYPTRRNVNVVTDAAPVQVALSTLKAVLDTVKIRASRLPGDRNGNGFEQRRRSGMGKFISDVDIQKLPAVVTTDLFRRIPSLRVENDTIKTHGAFEPWCAVYIFIDDHLIHDITPDEIDSYVSPEHIRGIEIYSETNAPPQYQVGLGGCGSIVIWTK